MLDPTTLLVSLALAAQTPAAAEDAPSNETATAAKSDDDKIICRRTAVIGSKFKKKVCGTKKQWETLQNRSASTTQEWQRRGKGLNPEDVGGPGG